MCLYNLSQEISSLSDKRKEYWGYINIFRILKAFNFLEFERLKFPTLYWLTTMQPFIQDKDCSFNTRERCLIKTNCDNETESKDILWKLPWFYHFDHHYSRQNFSRSCPKQSKHWFSVLGNKSTCCYIFFAFSNTNRCSFAEVLRWMRHFEEMSHQ